MLKRSLNRIVLTVILSSLSTITFAQTVAGGKTGGFDQTMRSHDKIYVVMAVCLIILVVMILYLVRIDAKISKKEKNT